MLGGQRLLEWSCCGNAVTWDPEIDNMSISRVQTVNFFCSSQLIKIPDMTTYYHKTHNLTTVILKLTNTCIPDGKCLRIVAYCKVQDFNCTQMLVHNCIQIMQILN